MPQRVRASIVVIGDEILSGFVQDTNSGWLAERLRHHGVPLERVVTVPDEPAAITEALGTELDRSRPRVVFTSGGIGTTPDDRTMEAVAALLGVDLVADPVLDERISAALQRSADDGAQITGDHEQALRRMALVPAGAAVLGGVRSMAPAVTVDLDGGHDAGSGATIVVLPGIPGELRRIVSTTVEPELLAGRGTPVHVEELTHPYPESLLTPVLTALAERFPELGVGSYPGPVCTVRLSGPRAQVRTALAQVREQLAALEHEPSADALRRRWQARWQPSG